MQDNSRTRVFLNFDGKVNTLRLAQPRLGLGYRLKNRGFFFLNSPEGNEIINFSKSLWVAVYPTQRVPGALTPEEKQPELTST